MLDEERVTSERMKAEIDSYEKSMDQEHLRAKATERTIARLDREKATVEKKITAEISKATEARQEVETKLEEVSSLEGENRERIRQQMEELDKRLKETQEGIRARETTITEMEKKESDLSSKLKQSQAAYEALRTEKTSVSKDLLQAQDDISELKRKNKVQTNQIEQLKEDIHAKDRALVAEEFVRILSAGSPRCLRVDTISNAGAPISGEAPGAANSRSRTAQAVVGRGKPEHNKTR
jgi:chromosome segregation ATPase